ncbi:hypothetical protein BDV34DRAFT_202038 [Aspergillus parasiticus]|uniref:Uncharacterized protein n=1 Tax=Aspergillus parasiticus TaxID=5067 RepID=A0A5N6D9S8_ASPPA|nr:hypothetical protein BDV34DRAFT_202038 [Aspergillus parasiticus]
MLFRVPALPAHLIRISTVSFGSSSFKAVLSAASSISRVTEGSKCSVGEKVKETRNVLLLGIDTPVSCTCLGSVFRHRSWSSGSQRTVTNYVGILSLAWAYILSARLVEMQQQRGRRFSIRMRKARISAAIFVMNFLQIST